MSEKNDLFMEIFQVLLSSHENNSSYSTPYSLICINYKSVKEYKSVTVLLYLQAIRHLLDTYNPNSRFLNFRAAELRLKLPEVECEDGSLISPLVLKHEDGSVFDCHDIQPCLDINQKTSIILKIKYVWLLSF